MKKFLFIPGLLILFLNASLAQEIIVESRSGGKNFSGYSEVSGKWTDSVAKSLAEGCSPDEIGSRFVIVDTGGVQAEARFTPELPKEGKYDIYVTWSRSGNAYNVKYAINTGSKEEVKYLDQAGWGGEVAGNSYTWIHVGTYNLPAGNKAYVAVLATEVKGRPSEPNSGRIYTDAIKFVPADGSGIGSVSQTPVSSLPAVAAASTSAPFSPAPSITTSQTGAIPFAPIPAPPAIAPSVGSPPFQPAQPATSSASSSPFQPSAPATSFSPFQPATQPSKPGTSSSPFQPAPQASTVAASSSSPFQPSEPSAPSKSSSPFQSSAPAMSSSPFQPATQPSKPATSSSPFQPAPQASTVAASSSSPFQPSQPVTSSASSSPFQPSQPVTSAASSSPFQSSEPSAPSTSSSPFQPSQLVASSASSLPFQSESPPSKTTSPFLSAVQPLSPQAPISAPAQIKWFTTYPEAIQAGIASKKCILLFFHSAMGKTSSAMEDEVLNDPAVRVRLDQYYICCKLDINQNRQVCDYYSIFKAPVLVFLDSRGYSRARIDIVIPAAQLAQELEKFKQ